MANFSFSRKSLLIIAGLAALVILLLLFYVFPGKVILPQALRFGPLSIRFYGLFLALAAAAGYFMAVKRLPQYNIPREQADNLLLVLLVSGFIGARLYHVASDWQYYAAYSQFILAVWYGGLSIFGAMIGGIIGLIIYLRYNKQVTLWRVLDWLAPSVSIGQAIGRFGNLFNYEAYGRPTNWPWKMFVPPQFRLAPYELNSYFHPLFLYEALGSLIIAWLLLRLSPKAGAGQLFLLWLFLYNGMRFFLEILRVDSVRIGSIKVNLVVALLLALLGLFGFLYRQTHAISDSRDH